MEKTTCKTYFSIVGEFDLNTVSEILKIENTHGHNIGDPKQYGTGTCDFASWQYGTEYIETLFADEQAEILLEPLMNKTDELLMIKEKLKCNFILMQVPKIENGYCPSMGFGKRVIEFCAHTGTEIQIDLYANPYKSKLK